LSRTQCGELLRSRMQFEFCGNHRFHT
jgi:hypothetical protein